MDFLFFKIADRTFTFPLNKRNKYIAGSLPSCQIYLPFRGVSKEHFSLSYENKKCVIEDLKSKNGTFLNGKRIEKKFLNYKDKIKAGIIELYFYFKEDEKFISFDISETNEKFSLPDFSKETDTIEKISDLEDIYFLPGIKFPEGFIFGRSASMYNIYRKFALAVQSSSSILFVGETGTGKEMFSLSYHLTKYNNDNFVEVNCAAIPSELAESELFGIKKGTATGVLKREGKILKAKNGTLLLDEIDSLPYEIQGKLLRAIEEKKIYPVGENKPIKVDFSLISSMQKNPDNLIEKNILREDLYHRISEIEIRLPSLKERKEDIPLFIDKFLKEICIKEKKRIAGISCDLFEALENYNYSGNIRELKNFIKEMVVSSPPNSNLNFDLLPEKFKNKICKNNFKEKEISGNKEGGLKHMLDSFAKEKIEEVLKSTNYNISKTAKILKLSRRGLQKMIKRLKIYIK